MSKLNTYKDDFFILLESGFIAVNQADEDSAVKLFKAAEKLDPKNELPIIGLGYLHFHKLELRQACEIFEKVLKKNPENEMAKTFLGICLTMSPNAVQEGEDLLEEMHNSSDDLIKGLSHTAIDFVEKFIKKDPTPVEVQKKKKTKKKNKS